MGNTTIGTVWQATRAWIEQPFRSNMSVGGWFLFFGMICVVAIAWSRILDHIGE